MGFWKILVMILIVGQLVLVILYYFTNEVPRESMFAKSITYVDTRMRKISSVWSRANYAQNFTDVGWLNHERRLGSNSSLTVFYNRVPKCASTTLGNVFQQMSSRNGFKIYKSRIYNQMNISFADQHSLARTINELERPSLHDRHVHFLNFSKFGISPPVYINVVRDPLERMVSWYYFIRFQGTSPGQSHYRNMTSDRRYMTFDDCVASRHLECTGDYEPSVEGGFMTIIPFFCGQEYFCRTNSREALEQAKKNVEKYYLVVGTTSELEKFLEVLEHVMPSMFRNASSTYRNLVENQQTLMKSKKKILPSEYTVKVMKNKMRYEYEFYDFVVQRFNFIYNTVINRVRDGV